MERFPFARNAVETAKNSTKEDHGEILKKTVVLCANFRYRLSS